MTRIIFENPVRTARNLPIARSMPASWMFCLLILLAYTGSVSAQEEEDQTLTVVCSTTQIADFARNVVGDRWEVAGVLAAGEDPHTYETGTDDAGLVARADLCLDNGWNLEGHDWMRQLAENNDKPIQSCVEGVHPLEIEEGESTINDPHAWFDPAHAARYVDNIAEAVSQVDPDHAEEYAARATLYKMQLVALDNWIQQQLASIPGNRRVLVTHHDAFGYFCQRYQFEAFSPLSWTTGELIDAGVNEKKQIIDRIRELNVKAIFVESSTNRELVDSIARDAGVELGGSLYSDAMGPEGSPAETYIGMMRENVLTLVESLK